MIRSALIALGLSASGLSGGAVSAQGMVPTAPIVDICGGTRLVLEAVDGSDDLDAASDVVSARLGGAFSQVFDYTKVSDKQILVSLPLGPSHDISQIEPLLQRVDFGFHTIIAGVPTGEDVALEAEQIVLPFAEFADESFILDATPIVDGGAVIAASQTFDQNNTPAVQFRFNEVGARAFSDYTADNIGNSFAIVLDGKVMSIPRIMSTIAGGDAILTGSFTKQDAQELAVILQGGVLPFDLIVVETIPVDGSNPSADFCP